MRLLKAFGLGKKAHAQDFSAPIRPDQDVVVIGDIHGQVVLLEQALADIAEIAPDTTVVCLGDLIDRGEESAAVLKLLCNRKDDPNLMCLMGNHEHMCLRFLEDPEKHGPAWLRYGGLQTLASFGIGLAQNDDLMTVKTNLVQAMGPKMIAWLSALPSHWISGNVAVTHAGADPFQPIQHQPRHALLWGHPDFEKIPRADGMWVVHGHTIVEEPTIHQGRIAIDTGAYATGRLTAVRLSRQEVAFMTITSA